MCSKDCPPLLQANPLEPGTDGFWSGTGTWFLTLEYGVKADTVLYSFLMKVTVLGRVVWDREDKKIAPGLYEEFEEWN